MNRQREYMSCSETLSLLTLRIALTDARRAVPPYVATHDMDKKLAAEAIEKMKRQYKRPSSFHSLCLKSGSGRIVKSMEDW
jgi:hypothetical protein